MAYPSLEAFMTIEDTTEGRFMRLIHISIWLILQEINYLMLTIKMRDTLTKKIRILKLVNGEVDYKAQSVQLEVCSSTVRWKRQR